MQVVFRIAYSLAVAILFILFVIFGTRTLYSEPDYPPYPGSFAPPPAKNIYCEASGCYTDGTLITPEVEERLTAAERQVLDDQREFQVLQREYEDDRETYFRNVFIIAAVLGVLAIAIGVVLFSRVEAMPLGLMLGGIGALIYGWVEWARGPEEGSTTLAFAFVTVGLVVVLAGGYWFLGGRGEKKSPEPAKPD